MTDAVAFPNIRLARAGDPGYANAARLAGWFAFECERLEADSSEIVAALGAIIGSLWVYASEADFEKILRAVRETATAHRALQAKEEAEKKGELS